MTLNGGSGEQLLGAALRHESLGDGGHPNPTTPEEALLPLKKKHRARSTRSSSRIRHSLNGGDLEHLLLPMPVRARSDEEEALQMP